jgi:2-methylisocitrate lyase-like PEP mutase family enzyme
MVPTGKSPEIPAARLAEMGFALAIYPTVGVAAACAALQAAYEHLRAEGSTAGAPVPSFTMAELHELVGFPDVWAFERRFAETG